MLGTGPRWGILVPVMSRPLDRCSILERGSPETKPRSCGNQPAHESLFNRRLRGPVSCAAHQKPAHPLARTNIYALNLDSEHESRLLKNKGGLTG
jgi:hypothetical protein